MLCGIKPGLLFFEELPVEAALDVTGEQACCRGMKPGLQATDMLSGGAGAAWQKPDSRSTRHSWPASTEWLTRCHLFNETCCLLHP